MPDETTTAGILSTLAELDKKLAVFSEKVGRASVDIGNFSQELKETNTSVIKLKAAHEQCPFRKPEALSLLQKKSNGNSNVNSWTPASITKLVAAVISGIGVAFAAVITALKWIA